MSAIVERARIAAADARRDGNPSASEREKLKDIAAEFESMLLVQMLKDMRKAGQWDSSDEGDTYGAETMFETLDVELATHLAKARGIGLKDQLLAAFDRSMPAAPTTESAVTTVTSISGRDVEVPQAVVEAVRARLAPVPGAEFQVPGSVQGSVHGSVQGSEFEAGIKPLDGAVTSEFGWRRDPFTGKAKFHQGVDIRAAYGQEVKAAGAGTVVFSGEAGGYGTSVVVEHQDGTRTRYAHLSAALVEKGDQVGQGEAVGRAGRSGRATGTHLHFEVMDRDGRRVPPQQWAKLDVHMTGMSGD